MVTTENVTPDCPLQISQETIKKVEEFQYLGSFVTTDARCDKEIKKRLGIAKTAFKKIKHLLTNSRISVQTRERAIKTHVWSTLLYSPVKLRLRLEKILLFSFSTDSGR